MCIKNRVKNVGRSRKGPLAYELDLTNAKEQAQREANRVNGQVTGVSGEVREVAGRVDGCEDEVRRMRDRLANMEEMLDGVVQVMRQPVAAQPIVTNIYGDVHVHMDSARIAALDQTAIQHVRDVERELSHLVVLDRPDIEGSSHSEPEDLHEMQQ